MSSIASYDHIPDELDIRLMQRDTDPLPPTALVKLQFINRGVNPKFNYRWVLYEDGRLFLAKHSGDTSRGHYPPFDTELPTTPTKTLSPAKVQEVKEHLIQANFNQQAPYQVDNGVDDGSFCVVTARLNQVEHEVIYEAVHTELTKFLKTIPSS